MDSHLFPASPLAKIPDHIEALIFDCDGTLVDTMPTHYVAWIKTLDRYGVKFTEEQFYGFAGMPTVTIIEHLSKEQGISLSAERVAIEKEDVYMECIHGISPIAEVISIARREGNRRRMAVASGGWHRIVEASLTAVGILDLFPVIVGADDVEHGKPHPDVFLRAAELLKTPPTKCLIYEDGDMGFEAARRAGIQAVDVRPWYHKEYM